LGIHRNDSLSFSSSRDKKILLRDKIRGLPETSPQPEKRLGRLGTDRGRFVGTEEGSIGIKGEMTLRKNLH
jgi:hypothetical protein